MEPRGGERAERAERRRPILRPPSVPEHPGEAHEQRGEPGERERQADQPGRREKLQRVVVGMAPGAREVRRLRQGERLAKRPEAGAQEREPPHEVERRAPGLHPHAPAGASAAEAQQPPEPLLPADQGDHGEAGQGEGQPAREPALRLLPRREQGSLRHHRRQRGDHSGARAGESQTGEQQQPDDDRRSDPEQPAFHLGLFARAAKRPPSPGEDQRQGEPEKKSQVVGIDEGPPQPFARARHLASPNFVRAGEPAPRAVEGLKERGGDERQGEDTPPPPVPAGDPRGEQGGGGGGERQGGAEGFGRGERQGDRAAGQAQQLSGGVEQSGVAGRERRAPTARPFHGLGRAEERHGDERPGGPAEAAEHGGRVVARERQGEEREGGDVEQRLAPRGDAAERKRRPDQENRDRDGPGPFGLAYHRATVP